MADEPRTPPKDFPPNDWAVIRSAGELCRYDGRIWRWDGRDWHLVIGPNLTIQPDRVGD